MGDVADPNRALTHRYYRDATGARHSLVVTAFGPWACGDFSVEFACTCGQDLRYTVKNGCPAQHFEPQAFSAGSVPMDSFHWGLLMIDQRSPLGVIRIDAAAVEHTRWLRS